ncbi:hypothetical protein [Aliiruegeria lutimaris]|uniref:Regulator RcnB of Ni and Co efflux n=1 Tax=Aliiruegeria lutimaris TaxID=571298 RepID=A0A1G8UIS8_9RHOB|nr:hypothetical protein [Aliiruegeria lutimaris]SDJ53678.1 hypothetical protein SAMN04488026_101929 [Aliiruegeria lutimaris]
MTAKGALMLVVSIALAASTAPGMADSKKADKIYKVPPGKSAGTPPGLAEKPGGMPPGQYKKIYRKGEQLPSGYRWITDYDHWRLPTLLPGQGYVRYDNEVYRVARDTAIVLEAIGIVSDLMR